MILLTYALFGTEHGTFGTQILSFQCEIPYRASPLMLSLFFQT